MPVNHADAIDKLSGTLAHLAKAKVGMDGAHDGQFGQEYAAAVAATRDQINGGIIAATTAIQTVLAHETGERAIAVQQSLLGPTVNEELAAREKGRKKKDKKAAASAEPDIPLRPTYALFHFKPSDEVYAVRFYHDDTGAQPTGLVLYEGYSPTDDRSLEEQVASLPHLKYDANPEVVDWFKTDAADFEAIAGMTFPLTAPAEEPAAEKPVEEPAPVES